MQIVSEKLQWMLGGFKAEHRCAKRYIGDFSESQSVAPKWQGIKENSLNLNPPTFFFFWSTLTEVTSSNNSHFAVANPNGKRLQEVFQGFALMAKSFIISTALPLTDPRSNLLVSYQSLQRGCHRQHGLSSRMPEWASVRVWRQGELLAEEQFPVEPNNRPNSTKKPGWWWCWWCLYSFRPESDGKATGKTTPVWVSTFHIPKTLLSPLSCSAEMGK